MKYFNICIHRCAFYRTLCANGLRRRRKVSIQEESRMPDGSEFQTAGAATLKPREAKVVRTRGADNRLVFAERRPRVGVW